jgi:hypothetical protein
MTKTRAHERNTCKQALLVDDMSVLENLQVELDPAIRSVDFVRVSQLKVASGLYLSFLDHRDPNAACGDCPWR